MKNIYFLISLFLIQFICGQSKIIEGDTSTWRSHNIKLYSQFGLNDLLKSNKDFQFRVNYDNQIIDIKKDLDFNKGTITSYAFRVYGKGRETLYQTVSISKDNLEKLIELIDEFNLNTMRPMQIIENWKNSHFSNFVFFEFSTKSKYKHSFYSSLDLNQSILEASMIQNFLKELQTLLSLKKKQQLFFNSLPKKGCYFYNGLNVCYARGGSSISYVGSTKLPLGIDYQKYIMFIGNREVKINLGARVLMNTRKDYNLQLSLRKNILFLRNKDYLEYEYRIRDFDFLNVEGRATSHSVFYGLRVNNKWSVSLGFSELRMSNNSTAFASGLNYSFKNTDFTLFNKNYFFNNRVDYMLGVSKPIKLLEKNFDVAIFYEKFLNYKDINLLLSIYF